MAETIEERFAIYLANVDKQMQVVQELRAIQDQRISDLQAAVATGADTIDLVAQLNQVSQVLDAQMSATMDVVATPPGIVGLTATVGNSTNDSQG